MNSKSETSANRLLASFLTVALLVSSPAAVTNAQAHILHLVSRSFHDAENAAMESFIREIRLVKKLVVGRERKKEGKNRDEFRGTELPRGHSGLGEPFSKPAINPSLSQPKPRGGDANFFNGPLIFTTMMENATKPACGCSGEPTYNQGISLIAEDSPKCQSVGSFPGIAQDTGHATVFLHNGEFFLFAVDLEIKGRGFSWKFERKYRSGINFEGPLGHNWEFNYNRRLFIDENGDVIRMDGHGRADRYTRTGATFTAPAGFYTRLTQNPDGTFVERDKGGTKVLYSAPDAQKISRMTELRDRNGNRMRFIYNNANQLAQVIETLGRSIFYRYNNRGHLIEVEDFTGRKIKFQYDDETTTARIGPSDLTGVTSQAVIGTPNANDFPNGKTTQYQYSSGFADEKLNHNLLKVIAPNEVATSGQPRVLVEYDSNPASANVDRVLHQSIGGANASGVAAGGAISYEYRSLGVAPSGDFTTAVFQNTVTDRNGNLTEYRFNQLANIVRVREFTNRNIRQSDPDFFETRYEYNKDGEMTRMIMPEGNSVETVYDDQNSSRFQQGNHLSDTRNPDARRGGDQSSIRASQTYEPIYNRIRSETDPRGNDPAYVPQNGGTASADRYTTLYVFDYQEGTNFAGLAQELGVSVADVMQLLATNNIPMGLGDVNGDGRTDLIAGNMVKAIHPIVNMLPDSNMTRLEGGTRQPVVERFQYNQFGQITRSIDAEANVNKFDYHPENDPDGDGRDLTPGVGSGSFGYLKETIKDAESNSVRDTGSNPTPAQIMRRYLYDRVGNLIKEVDGRGIGTAYSVNQLNQVVEIRRAADVSQALVNPEEPNWNACADPALVECRAGMASFNYRTRIFYDSNNNVIKREIENRDSNNVSLAGQFVEHSFVYDILDNLVEEQKEVSESPREVLVTKYRYDRNENRVLTISPVANLPAGNPERQPSNVVSSVVDERDLVSASTRGGMTTQFRTLAAHVDIGEIALIPSSPDISTYEHEYDTNRNPTKGVDCADNTGDGQPETTFRKFDGFDRAVSDIDAVGNQSLTTYDSASNVISVARFGPAGGRSPSSNSAATLRQPLRRGDITQPLLSQAEFKFDEMSRMFERNDLLFDYRNQGVRYMRAPILIDGPLGRSNDGIVVTRYEYDRNSRRTFLIKDNLDTSQTIYDGASRAVREIDPEGNEIFRTFDDNNNVVKVVEIEITQRKDVASGKSPDLRETFTTIAVFDSLNRQIRATDNLGLTARYQYDSRDNIIQTSDAQHSASDADLIADPLGLFPMAGQSGNRINRPGNTMDYFLDGQSRKIAEEHQLRVGGQGKNAIDTSNPANPDGLIVIDYDWDANSRLVAMADDGSTPGDQNTSIGVIEPVNPKGNVTRYVYDDLNRRKQEVFDDGTIKDYNYDCDDNAVRVIDQNGTIINRTFDGDNRLVRIDVNRANSRTAHKAGGFKDPNVRWEVTGTTLQTFEYDGLSRLTLAFDNNDPADPLDDQPVTYSYDSLNRVLEERQCEFPVSSRWSGDKNRLGLVYPNGRAIEMTFDKLDRIDTISDVNPLASANQAPIVDYDYIGSDRVLERTYSNGVKLTHLNDDRTKASGFDAVKRMVSHRHLDKQRSLIAGFEYTYDRTNNKLSEKENRGSDSVRAESYEYDSAYRLTKFDRSGESAADNWQLDGVGNWAARRDQINEANNMNEYTVFGRTIGTPDKSGATTGTIPGTPGQPGSSQLHDDNGNLLDDGTNLYGYDFVNRLRRVTRKADRALVAVYSYDAHNRRFQAAVTNSRSASTDLNGVVRYFYDGWREIEERGGSRTQQYVYGMWIDEPLTLDIDGNNDGRIEPSDSVGVGDSTTKDKRFFYSDDGKRYISALTDNRGAVVERYRYDAYGVPTITDSAEAQRNQSAVNNRYLFNGRRLDPEIGLYYYRNRYMDPRTGRFIHRDPLGMWADELNFGNAYTYIANNPVCRYDPLGLIAFGVGGLDSIDVFLVGLGDGGSGGSGHGGRSCSGSCGGKTDPDLTWSCPWDQTCWLKCPGNIGTCKSSSASGAINSSFTLRGNNLDPSIGLPSLALAPGAMSAPTFLQGVTDAPSRGAPIVPMRGAPMLPTRHTPVAPTRHTPLPPPPVSRTQGRLNQSPLVECNAVGNQICCGVYDEERLESRHLGCCPNTKASSSCVHDLLAPLY